jgi:hypothetical protein
MRDFERKRCLECGEVGFKFLNVAEKTWMKPWRFIDRMLIRQELWLWRCKNEGCSNYVSTMDNSRDIDEACEATLRNGPNIVWIGLQSDMPPDYNVQLANPESGIRFLREYPCAKIGLDSNVGHDVAFFIWRRARDGMIPKLEWEVFF